jgi:hypothetical protein
MKDWQSQGEPPWKDPHRASGITYRLPQNEIPSSIRDLADQTPRDRVSPSNSPAESDIMTGQFFPESHKIRRIVLEVCVEGRYQVAMSRSDARKNGCGLPRGFHQSD